MSNENNELGFFNAFGRFLLGVFLLATLLVISGGILWSIYDFMTFTPQSF